MRKCILLHYPHYITPSPTFKTSFQPFSVVFYVTHNCLSFYPSLSPLSPPLHLYHSLLLHIPLLAFTCRLTAQNYSPSKNLSPYLLKTAPTTKETATYDFNGSLYLQLYKFLLSYLPFTAFSLFNSSSFYPSPYSLLF